MNNEIKSSIKRIEVMELLFDKTLLLHEKGDKSNELSKALTVLKEYYENGQWLHDYELDENGLLPKELKRGVLSQDGLYELICDIENMYKM